MEIVRLARHLPHHPMRRGQARTAMVVDRDRDGL
jgi:hypothetical protein